jgi:tRNA pseudouridine55 synthase
MPQADTQGRSPSSGDDQLDGVLVVDKPAGPTSHDVVARVRRAAGVRRVGHTGTLDPFATGVLPLVLGRATRLARFLSSAVKTYRATVVLGLATSTHDLLGEPLERGRVGPRPSRQGVEVALERFRGPFAQRPPAFSAKKIEGVRAYARARRDEPVVLEPVPVEVFRLDLEDWSDDGLVLSLECSAGFYVRALARDLGEVLGCGAHLAELRRTRSGAFGEDQAWPLASIERAVEPLSTHIVPLDTLLGWLPGAVLTPEGAARARHGNRLSEADVTGWQNAAPAPATDASGHDTAGNVRLLAPDRTLLGVARREPRPGAGFLQPFVVLV